MRISRFLLATLAVCLAAGTAAGAIVLRVTVEELAEKATLVIEGEVLEAKARWSDDGSTINTYVRVRVDEVLKGQAAGEVTITCPGGAVGEDKVDAHGVPGFEVGEKVVVFLWKNKLGDLLPLGLRQGKFRLEKDPETGKTMARNSLKGLTFAVRGEAERKKVMSRKADVLPLADLRRRVRERVVLVEKKAREAAEKAAREKKAAEPAEEEGSGDQAKTDPDAKKPEAEAPDVKAPAGNGEEPGGEKPKTPDPEKKKPGEEAPPGRR